MPSATKWLTDAIAVRASVSKGEGLSFPYRPNAQYSQASVERMRSVACRLRHRHPKTRQRLSRLGNTVASQTYHAT